MILCRFGEGRLGLVEGAIVRDVTAALDVLPAYRYPLPSHDVLYRESGSGDGARSGDRRISRRSCRWRA